MSTTAIASLEPRRRATVAGQIRSVQSYERPYPCTDAELDDGTGTLRVRFLGRRQVPGLAPKLSLEVEGTPRLQRGTLVMLNPLYCFVPAE